LFIRFIKINNGNNKIEKKHATKELYNIERKTIFGFNISEVKLSFIVSKIFNDIIEITNKKEINKNGLM
jgi:hypothetical protein